MKRTKSTIRGKILNIVFLNILIIANIVIFCCFSFSVRATAGSTCASANYICACDPNCQFTYENPPSFNTIDGCQDGSKISKWEYVEKMIITNLNSSNFKGGNTVQIYVQYFCYKNDWYGIAYSNNSNGVNTVWKNIYSGKCNGYNFWNLYYNFTLDTNEGAHAFRFMIGYPGAEGMTCGQAYTSSDTDDIVFYVEPLPDYIAPTISSFSPSNGDSFEYIQNLAVPIIVYATDETGIDKIYANVSWGNYRNVIELMHYSGNQYNATFRNTTNITQYSINFIARDVMNNSATAITNFYIVNNAEIKIISPSLLRKFNYPNISLKFKIVDNNTPFQLVYYKLNSGNEIPLNETLAIVNNQSENNESEQEIISENYITNGLWNISQSIIPNENMTINKIRIKVFKNISEDFNVIFQIRTNNNGTPSSTSIFNYTLESNLIFNISSWIEIPISGPYNPIDLLNATTYWLFIETGNENQYLFFKTNNNRYTGGALLSNSSRDLLFHLIDAYKYVAILNCSDGSNTVQVYSRNSLGLTESSSTTFTVDTKPPIFNAPTETQDPFEFGQNYQFIRILVSDQSTLVNNVLIETDLDSNCSNQTTDTLAGNIYQYRWGINKIGTYFYKFFFNDSLNNKNFTQRYNFSVTDTKPPILSNLIFWPNSSADLDPEKTIFFNITVSDYSEILNITLMINYLNNGSMQNFSMHNLSSVYSANFTPSDEGNWSAKVFCVDAYNNSNLSRSQNFSTYYDLIWNVTPLALEEGFTSQGIIIHAGDILINNTGDFILNFSVSKYFGVPNVFLNETAFSLNAGQYKTINVSVQAPETNSVPYLFSVIARCLTTNCEMANYTLNGSIAVGEGGPYMSFIEVLYDPSVTQGDRGIILNATIKNIGTDTAVNVTINWSLPYGWLSDENFSSLLGNITPYQITFQVENYGIMASVNLSATIGQQNLTIILSYFTPDYQAREKIYTKTVNVNELIIEEDEQEPEVESPLPPSGGGGGAGVPKNAGGGVGALPTRYDVNNLIFFMPKVIEIVRGQNKTIYINITNDNNIYFENVSLTLTGLARSRYSIELWKGIMEGIIKPNQTLEFSINFDIPIYMSHSVQTIKFSLSGLAKQNTGLEKFRQEEELTLIVSEVDENESALCLVQSQILISEMEKMNFSVDYANELLKKAQEAYNGMDHTEVKKQCDMIKKRNDKSLELYERLLTTSKNIENARREGYDINPLNKIIDMSKEFFRKGDLENAEESLEKADISLTLLINAEDSRLLNRASKFLRNNWWAASLGLISLIVGLVVSYRLNASRRIIKRLSELEKEEKIIIELTKKTQREHFVEKIVGENTYKDRMDRSQKRLADIEEEKIMLKNIKVGFFKIKAIHEDLNKQKEEFVNLIKDIQQKYYVEKMIDRQAYDKTFKVYSKNLSDVDRKIALKRKIERSKNENNKEKKKNKEGKDNNEKNDIVEGGNNT